MKKIGIGLAGFGTVGQGVYKHLEANRVLMSERLGGLEMEVCKVLVRDASRTRPVRVDPALLTTDWRELVEDDRVRIVVELIGGLEQARELVLAALKRGKIVVTANKALLAEHGHEIFAAAEEHDVPVLFEAAVAGGIPIIKAVQEGFIGNHIESAYGIINGTCNYILTRMSEEEGLDYSQALDEAGKLGYAEADPTLDINGWDAAHKAIILASLAYGFWVEPREIHVEGVDKITAADMRYAGELGYTIKLLAVIKAHDDGSIEVRVHPTLVPRDHVLASVSGVFNAIMVNGNVVGETLFYGRGAGQDPTASAVISDLAVAASDMALNNRPNKFRPHGLYGKCKPFEEIVSEYFLRLQVEDRPGVLAKVSGVLAAKNIGISSVIQPLRKPGCEEKVPLILMIHDAMHRDVINALEEITQFPFVDTDPALLRVESFGKS
jgi:homoserine dehydrogenase